MTVDKWQLFHPVQCRLESIGLPERRKTQLDKIKSPANAESHMYITRRMCRERERELTTSEKETVKHLYTMYGAYRQTQRPPTSKTRVTSALSA